MKENSIQFVESEPFFEIACEAIDAGKAVTMTPRGTSMLPTLRDQKDQIELVAAPKELKKYDVILYRRRNGQYVLHRIVALAKDGTYTLCGDHHYCLEKGIDRSQVLAILQSFKRGRLNVHCKRSILYRLYSIFWVESRLARRYFPTPRRVWGKIRRLAKGKR